MDAKYQEALEALCQKNRYQEIIDAILEIPEEERSYPELTPYIQKYLLHGVLHHGFEVPDTVGDDEDCIHIPEWKVAITPQISQITHKSIVLDMHLYFPVWGKEIYECSAGMGTDLKQAFAMAAGSFLFSLMDGIGAMESNDRPKLLHTEFAGRPHDFQVYLSNIVGMGNSPQSAPDVYWQLLKEDIRKRLGNQEFCFVKVYAAKVNGQVTSECRIDDKKSEELSQKVAELAEKWEAGDFASHKQFFLIRQEAGTLLPYPYSGPEGQERFGAAVIQAARLFHQANTQELYDTLRERLAEAIGDATLAQECCIFLPELCAQNAFPEISYSETLDITCGDASSVTCYTSQLADYWPMWDVFITALQDGTFGEEGNQIYQEYISVSSIFNVVKQIKEKGSSLSGCRLTSLLCQTGDDFQIR